MVAAAAVSGSVAGSAGGSSKLIAPGYLHIAPGTSSNDLTIAVRPTCCPPSLGGPPPRWAISVYAPAEFVPSLTLPVGTPIGRILAGEPGGALVTVSNPATFVDDPCAPGGHAAVWTANPILSNTRVAIRVFVDPTNSEHALYGAYRLTFCDMPFLALHLRGAFTVPTATGFYMWRAFVTPLNSTTGAPFPDSTYELRALVPVPHVLHVKASYLVRSRTLVLSGSVTAAGKPEASTDVEVAQTDDVRQPVYVYGTTSADGTFRFTKRVGQTRGAKRLLFDASTWKDEPCTSPSPFRYCRQRTSPATLSFTATIPGRFRAGGHG